MQRVPLREFANPAPRRLRYCIPVGCAPEAEPAPFVDIGLPFFAMDDRYEFPPGDDKPFPDSWPVTSAGDARFDTGPSEKMYGRFGWVSVWDPPTRICVQDA